MMRYDSENEFGDVVLMCLSMKYSVFFVSLCMLVEM